MSGIEKRINGIQKRQTVLRTNYSIGILLSSIRLFLPDSQSPLLQALCADLTYKLLVLVNVNDWNEFIAFFTHDPQVLWI